MTYFHGEENSRIGPVDRITICTGFNPANHEILSGLFSFANANVYGILNPR